PPPIRPGGCSPAGWRDSAPEARPLARRPCPAHLTAARREIQEPAWRLDDDAMPDAARHHEGLAASQGDAAFASLFVEHDIDRALDEIEQLVAVRVHLPGVRRTGGHPR